jgi:hypothetical protein
MTRELNRAVYDCLRLTSTFNNGITIYEEVWSVSA